MKFNQWKFVSYSDIGKRKENQDRELVLSGEKGLLAVIADGMGGHQNGSLAASELIKQTKLWYSDKNDRDLLRIIFKTHESLNETVLGNATPSLPEDKQLAYAPRTTCLILWINGEDVEIAHVGDSRCYQFHAGKLTKRTKDHSVVELLVLQGEVKEEDMGSHPDQNRLTQSIGGQTVPKPTHEKFKNTEGASFLLCSDGFWEHTKPQEMEKLLASKNLQDDLEKSIRLAVNRAGDTADNTTAVIVKHDGRNILPSDSPTSGTDDASIFRFSRRSGWLGVLAFVLIVGSISFLLLEHKEIPVPTPATPIERGQKGDQSNDTSPGTMKSATSPAESVKTVKQMNMTTTTSNEETGGNLYKEPSTKASQVYTVDKKPKISEVEERPVKTSKSIIENSQVDILIEGNVIVDSPRDAVGKVIEILRKEGTLSADGSLIFHQSEKGEKNNTYTRARQRYKDIPISKKSVVIVIDSAGVLQQVSGHIVPIDDFDIEAKISPQEAEQKWLNENRHLSQNELLSIPELVIYVDDNVGIQLAYRLKIKFFNNQDSRFQSVTLYLSAIDGRELYVEQHLVEGQINR